MCSLSCVDGSRSSTTRRACRGRSEQVIGELAQALLDSQMLENALAAAFGAREKAAEAQQAALAALNLPSAGDVERLERRLRSFSQRLEDVEDQLDRVGREVSQVRRELGAEKALKARKSQSLTLNSRLRVRPKRPLRPRRSADSRTSSAIGPRDRRLGHHQNRRGADPESGGAGQHGDRLHVGGVDPSPRGSPASRRQVEAGDSAGRPVSRGRGAGRRSGRGPASPPLPPRARRRRRTPARRPRARPGSARRPAAPPPPTQGRPGLRGARRARQGRRGRAPRSGRRSRSTGSSARRRAGVRPE